MAKFSVYPACGQFLEFRAIILDSYGVPGVYPEVNCSDLTQCYVEKCNGGSSTAGDIECDGMTIPYDLNFTVIIQAILQDGTIDESL